METESFLKLPLLSAHGAVLLYLLRVQPLQNAVHVEAVRALAPDQWAVVPRHLTVRAAAIESHPTDAAVLVISHPQPGCHSMPHLNLHLHWNTRQFCQQPSAA